MLVVAFAFAIHAAAAGASSSASYRDGLGDVVAAPDISDVRVANDDAGRFVWSIRIANRKRLELADTYVLWLDVDLNAGSGARGFDYAVVVDGGTRGASLARYDGGRWRYGAPQATLSVRWRGGPVVGIDRRELSSPEQLDFAIGAWAGGDVDWAPDRPPDWRFQPIVSRRRHDSVS